MNKTTTDLQLLRQGADFTWGTIVAFHKIAEYDIVEYTRNAHSMEQEQRFHIYIDGKSQSRSYDSLDAALVGAIAIKHDGINTRADTYFMKAIAP